MSKFKIFIFATVIATIRFCTVACINHKVVVESSAPQTRDKDDFKNTFEQITKDYVVEYANGRYSPKETDPKYTTDNVDIIRMQKYANEWESISEIRIADLLFRVVYNMSEKTVTVSMYAKTGVENSDLSKEEK